jgi:hypothetical protein
MQPPAPKDDGKAQQAAMDAKQQQGEQALQMKSQQADLDLHGKTMQAEKKLLEKDIDLQLREIQLKAEQDQFALAKQTAEQQIQMKEQVHSVKTSAADQVRTVKDQQAKQTSQQAETKLHDSAEAIKAVTAQMADFNTSLLKAIEQQAQHTAQVLEAVTKAVTAPKVRKAIRGRDGKIEAMEETVA